MHDYRQLRVWRKARDVVGRVYEATQRMPASERYGLTAQMRRASVSVVANIAEGAGRRTNADFARFVDQAVGSSTELEAELDICAVLGFLDLPTVEGIVGELGHVRAMLVTLAERLRKAA